MRRIQLMNPFEKRESHDKYSIFLHRFLTILAWLLVFVTTFVETFRTPTYTQGKTIWDQNKAYSTPFSLNPIITSIYWLALLFSQIGYICCLFRNNAELVTTVANVSSHFIVHNVLMIVFMILWVHAEFCFGELVLILNFFNLTYLYFRHPQTPRFVHIPVVSGPLAFTFVAIFWNGAAMIDVYTLFARILANVAVWCILFYGLFFLAAFNDYSMGWELSVLSLSLAIHQMGIKVIAFQWIFAFVVMGLLLAGSLGFTIPKFFGNELRFMGDVDAERQPLLDDE